ncbi:MAG: hypothetical protein HW405_206 [Candidatus Berkelbacteria bacterium]|nr:hypothetical protein [Candidatus Berkelbacteria bacterium]
MKDCIFCKIVGGEIPSAKIWEDDEFLAILDVNPNTRGMTLALTKKHYDSDAFLMPDEIYQRFFLAAKKVAQILEKGLSVRRVSMVMEGMGVNHAHIKLYPLHGLNEKFTEMWAPERKYFDKYPGYLSTQLGPQKDLEELQKLAKEIKNKDI